MARNKNRPKRSKPTLARQGYVPFMLKTIKREGIETRLLNKLDRLLAKPVEDMDDDQRKRFDREYGRTMQLIEAFGLKKDASDILDWHCRTENDVDDKAKQAIEAP